MSKTVTNEQIKLLAGFFNTVAAAFVTTGVLAPIVTAIYGFGGLVFDTWLIISSSVICMLISTCLHFVGRLILSRMIE
jgi:hypothetical protein